MLSGKKLKAFPVQSRNKTRLYALRILVNIMLEFLARVIWHEKEKKTEFKKERRNQILPIFN
jgi:hypothetical protein